MKAYNNTCKDCTLASVCGQWQATQPIQALSCTKQRKYGAMPPPASVVAEAIAYRTQEIEALTYEDVWGESKDNAYDFNVWYDETEGIVAVVIYPVLAGGRTDTTKGGYVVDPTAYEVHPTDRDGPPTCAACGEAGSYGDWHE